MIGERRHIVELQSLRGVAAMIVVGAHTLSYYRSPWFFEIGKNILANGQGAVVIFFVLSGFVLGNSLRGSALTVPEVSSFYMKRLFRIYPAMWLASALGMFYLLYFHYNAAHPNTSVWFQGRFKADRMSFIGILASLAGILAFILPPLWTIFNELVASVMIPFTSRLSFARPRNAWGLTILFALLAVTVGPHTYYGAALYPLDFQLGVDVAILYAGRKRPERGTLIWVLAFCVGTGVLACLRGVVLVFNPTLSHNDPVMHLVELAAGVAIISSIVLGGVSIPLLRNRFFEELGDISYSVYLFHFPVMCLTAVALGHVIASPQTTWIASLVLFTTTAIISFAVSAAVYRSVELPFVAVGRRAAARIKSAGRSTSSLPATA